MLTRLTRVQLTIFALVTVLAVGAITIRYIRLPAALGYGTYSVTANFAESGGLYPHANVTYRGSTIGVVTDVTLTRRNGVDAHLRLNADVPVPDNVTAAVRSRSAIGEMYIDLVPPSAGAPESLTDGFRIDRTHTALGTDISDLLAQTDQLIGSVHDSRVKSLLRETFAAFHDSGPDLARLIRAARSLIDDANAHAAETTGLIDEAGPFLDAQIAGGDDIGRTASALAQFTGNLRGAETQFGDALRNTPAAASAVDTAFTGIRPSFALLAANLANLGRIGVIYQRSIEQILVVLPATTAMLLTVAGQTPPDEGVKADFKLNLGDPPPCLTGFLPPTQIRNPADQTLRDIPSDLYCKVPQDDPTSVRGVRNYPCQEFPGRRAPTIQLCRDPNGYQPLGSNPWRGATGSVRYADH